IKGFRPGKVPTKVIEQRFGAQVRAEILDGMLRESFSNAVREEKLQIAGNPRIEPAVESGETLSYIATFEVVPDFGDIDVGKLEITRHTAEVTDTDIDAMIENLRLQRRTLTTV
ncbi:trigger factor, partial [Lysobacter sp. 2RAB21]